MPGKMDFFGITDVGRMRENNEDQFLIADMNKSMKVYQTSLGLDHQTRLFGGSQGKLFLVADGIGGHASGERASTIAVDTITAYVLDTLKWFYRLDDSIEDDFVDDLKQAVRSAQRSIRAESEAMPKRQGMGTTLTMAYVIWPRMYVLHAGDSRCYVVRGDDVQRVTCDHTVAQRLQEQGLENRETLNPRLSHMLWNVVGGTEDVLTVEAHRVDLQWNDTVVLCTDGLNVHVDDAQIGSHCQQRQSAEATCRALVDHALASGGRDNITVVVARFRDTVDTQTEALDATTDFELGGEKSIRDTDPYLPKVRLERGRACAVPERSKAVR